MNARPPLHVRGPGAYAAALAAFAEAKGLRTKTRIPTTRGSIGRFAKAHLPPSAQAAVADYLQRPGTPAALADARLIARQVHYLLASGNGRAGKQVMARPLGTLSSDVSADEILAAVGGTLLGLSVKKVPDGLASELRALHAD